MYSESFCQPFKEIIFTLENNKLLIYQSGQIMDDLIPKVRAFYFLYRSYPSKCHFKKTIRRNTF